MANKKGIDFTSSFDAVIEQRQNTIQHKLDLAKERIAELENLVQKQEAADVPLEQIEPNPEQPRKSFYVVQTMANLLFGQGQKQPIQLVKIPHKSKYVIFDGECRYRAANLLKWNTIKAVFLPYNSETFQTDVLISFLNKSSINSLDEAEAIVKKIQEQVDLSDTEICDKLAAFIVYTRRSDRLETLKFLTTNYKERDKYLKELNFRNEGEQIICQTIADLGRYVLSTSSNKFPLLKLSPDLKEAVRTKGLNETVALRLNTINPNSKKLKQKITELKAAKLREELIAKIFANEWSVKKATEAIKNTIQEILGDKEYPSNIDSYINYLNRMQIDRLSFDDKNLLLARLNQIISQLANS